MSQESQVYWVYCSGARHLKPFSQSCEIMEDMLILLLLLPPPPPPLLLHVFIFKIFHAEFSHTNSWDFFGKHPCALRKVATKPSKATFTLAPKPRWITAGLLPPWNKGRHKYTYSIPRLTSWWFQPLWKILVKLDHSPGRGKNKKMFETTT